MRSNRAKICTLEAPGKINLHLGIGEKRSDGFHALESLFVPLALGDTLQFEAAGKEGDCTISMNWEAPEEAVSRSDNLIYKAVSVFRERVNYKKGLHISVIKRIPARAGLGGGSSDAASSLLALNSLAGTALPMDELMEMAVSLGSDVPFFLSGGPAFVSGRGETIEPVEFPQKYWVILFKPPFPSDTAAAFRLLDRFRTNQIDDKLPKEKLPKEALIRSLSDAPETWPFYNDFLPVFLDASPEAGIYRAILDLLKDSSASFTGLSGSGSCCFGIFSTEDEARNTERKLKPFESGSCKPRLPIPQKGNFIRLTFFLARRAIPVLQY